MDNLFPNPEYDLLRTLIFYICAVITSCDNTFAIYINDIIAHHLPVTDFPQWREDFTDIINVFNATCHDTKLRIIRQLSKEHFKSVYRINILSVTVEIIYLSKKSRGHNFFFNHCSYFLRYNRLCHRKIFPPPTPTLKTPFKSQSKS